MLIYGLGIMGVCMLAGTLIGDLLGFLIGLGMPGFSGNVGGVGFAMLFLILLTDKLKAHAMFSAAAEGGIKFWAAFYIPVVVAMSSIQNVVAALKGGWVALLSASISVAVMFAFIKPLSAMAKKGGGIEFDLDEVN